MIIIRDIDTILTRFIYKEGVADQLLDLAIQESQA